MDIAIQDNPLLSIIVPCLGQAHELEACLQGLATQQSNLAFQVVVVDSGWDPAVAAAASRFRFVKLIRSKGRLSAGAARNLGVRNSGSDWLAFIDADCVPGAGWVEAVCSSLRSGHRMCGGPVLDLFPDHPTAWADNRLQFADFQAGRPAGPAGYFPGCNMAMSRADFVELGGFAEAHVSGEDTMLCIRAHSSFPASMFFDPSSLVRHKGRTRWPEFLDHQRLLGYRRTHSNLYLSASYMWMARLPLLAGLVVLRRLGYIGIRTMQYDPAGLIRMIAFFPWLLAGLIAWTDGFYHGYQSRDKGF